MLLLVGIAVGSWDESCDGSKDTSYEGWDDGGYNKSTGFNEFGDGDVGSLNIGLIVWFEANTVGPLSTALKFGKVSKMDFVTTASNTTPTFNIIRFISRATSVDSNTYIHELLENCFNVFVCLLGFVFLAINDDCLCFLYRISLFLSNMLFIFSIQFACS